MLYGRTPEEDQDVVPVTAKPDHICHVFQVQDADEWADETYVDDCDVADFQQFDPYYE